MRRRIAVLGVGAFLTAAAVAVAASTFGVHTQTYDPAHTVLVNSSWQKGIGCPTNAGWSDNGTSKDQTYTDPACQTGDSRDNQNQGLLLAKTGPEGNYATAQAVLGNVKGITLTELGYDIRNNPAIANEGSHCGAGSPRFEVTTTDGFWYVGCTSPPPDSTTQGDQWQRLRWGNGGAGSVMGAEPSAGYNVTPITGTVKSIVISFDESTPGSYGSPDGLGVAILDNIDVNGMLVGRQ